MHLKMSSGKGRSFCFGFNVLLSCRWKYATTTDMCWSRIPRKGAQQNILCLAWLLTLYVLRYMTHRTVNFMNEYKLLIRSLSTSVPQKTLRTMCEYTYTYVNSNRNNIHVSIVDFITLENCTGLTKKTLIPVWSKFIMYDYCLIINNDKWDIVVSRQHTLLHYIGHIISLVSILNIAILHANLPLNCFIYCNGIHVPVRRFYITVQASIWTPKTCFTNAHVARLIKRDVYRNSAGVFI